MKFPDYRVQRVFLLILSAFFVAGSTGSSIDQQLLIKGRVHHLQFLDLLLPAEIRFFKLDLANLELRPRLAGEARAGADGHYAVELPMGLYLVQVQSAGFQTTRALFDNNGNRHTLDLGLVQSYPTSTDSDRLQFEGYVLDSVGEAVPDATVALTSVHGALPADWLTGQTRTDEEGRYELRSWDRGFYVLAAVSPEKGVAARAILLAGPGRKILAEPLVVTAMDPLPVLRDDP